MDAYELRSAVIADRVGAVLAELGDDVNRALDDRGASALFFACTPKMLDAVLAAGADPSRILADGTSALDAPAREGELAMVRALLAAAPQLATEARALLAADHPPCEAAIRAVARGEEVLPVKPDAPVTWRRVPTTCVPPAPGMKGSQRYHVPARPGAVEREAIPAGLRDRIPANADVFRGHGDALLVFAADGARLVDGERDITFDIPRVPFPYEHAFAADGSHYFFAYGQMNVVGVETATGRVMLEQALPGGPWGTVVASLPGESKYGHSYPIRLAVSDGWLALVSLERIFFIPFGAPATQAVQQWFTCQLGTCVASVLDGRAFVVGARSGSAVYGIGGARLQKLCDLEPPGATAKDPLHTQLRMILRVSGNGHDDPRTLDVLPAPGGTHVSAFGHGGLDEHKVFVPGLVIDPADLSSKPITRPEIVDVFELDRDIIVRVSPIGGDAVQSYALDGIDALWRASFEQRDLGEVQGDSLIARRAPFPPPMPPVHPTMGELSYPTVGRNGYGIGYKVSSRPGFWNTYVVSPTEGVRPLTPHWFNGATCEGLHDVHKRAVLSSGREAIEIDLETATWRARPTNAGVRGICYFENGIALMLHTELQIFRSINAKPTRVFRCHARDAQLVSFHNHRVLWVPTIDDRNVFLARRDGEFVVLGVLEDCAATGELTSQNDAFLKLPAGALQLVNFERAIASAPRYSGQPLHELREPRIAIT